MAREQADYEAAQAALQREAGVLVIDVKKAELLTEKVLKGHSVRLKVALSEWAVRTAENLQRSEVRLRDQAAAMLAIKAIGNQLYGWDRESDLQRMARAVTSYADAEPAQTPTAAVNLALINTTPEQLAALAKENGYRDGQEVASPTEDNGLSMESSPVAPEQSRAAGGGWPSSEKEAPPLPVKQPGKSEPTASLRPVPTKQDSQSDPLPPAGHPASSTSVSESEARQKAFEQLRAEHRRACRLKYG